jgi:hypothetical protein
MIILIDVNRRIQSIAGGNRGGDVAVPAPVADPTFNPEQEYAIFMHDSLVGAMLDNALALPIAPNQSLTVIVSTGANVPVDPMAPPIKKLHLVLKGEDLLALRQNRITRDEAKKRIIEKRY